MQLFYPLIYISLQLPKSLISSLETGNVDGGVEGGNGSRVRSTEKAEHLSSEDILAILGTGWKSDVEGDTSEDVGLGRTEIGGRGDIAQGTWEAFAGCYAESDSDIVDGLNVVGSGQGDSEWVIGVDCGGSCDAGDDGGRRGDEGGGQDGDGGSCETHVED